MQKCKVWSCLRSISPFIINMTIRLFLLYCTGWTTRMHFIFVCLTSVSVNVCDLDYILLSSWQSPTLMMVVQVQMIGPVPFPSFPIWQLCNPIFPQLNVDCYQYVFTLNESLCPAQLLLGSLIHSWQLSVWWGPWSKERGNLSVLSVGREILRNPLHVCLFWGGNRVWDCCFVKYIMKVNR